ncbi:RNA polymerase sigma factor [uncultured Pseudokineococcus sp.]|uniref:RNA polymerase sigma factor n=1 Tax=uncultured Pseudokineococcus sp. TaxID=1642928 RepID=UPI002604715F|nr:sigma-70 family RNA polymerase sigma factor [uncultured Pseudokineococcus sp.]
MVMPRNGEEPAVQAVATQPEDFETFYREHLPFVRSYLARRVSDPFVIADLTADVFVAVIRSAESYRRELGPPRAWLTGVARRVLADHWRAGARESDTVRRLQGRRLLDDDGVDRIVQRVDAEAGARALLASIAQLPDPLRNVVELVAVDGLAVTDAAAVLGITPGAARVRYHRARRALTHDLPSDLHEVTL